jgi:hypothetical protein
MNTFLDILQDLRSRVLEHIAVFDQGYAYARPDNKKGLVVTTGDDARHVSITDLEGDYFYIRVPNAITNNTTKTKTDCSVAIGQRHSCTLVAVVREVDEFGLSDALVNELLRTKVIDVKAVWIDPIAIIESEFKGLDKRAVETAMSRIGNRTLVRVDFDITRIFESHNCSYNICKPC